MGGVGSVRFTPDGTTLISVGDDRSVRFWDILGNREPTLRGHQNWIEAAEFTPGGQFIVTSSGDGTARVWDLEGNVITEFTEHDGWIHDVSVTSDGLIATAADDFLVKLWDLQGNTISEFRNPESPVWDLAFSPDGQQVALGTSLGIVRILDLQGNVVQDFKARNDSIWKINFSPDGKKLGTTAEDGGFRLWSLEGKLLSHSLENQEAVWGFQFSPNGNWLITASNENTLRLLNVDGKLIREFQAHNGEVRDVTFSPDSRYIASASDDTTVRVWDLEGNQLAEFHDHSGPVSSVSFSPDSEFLVTSSYDDTARIWRFRTLDKLLEAGCQWLENYLLTYPSQLLELEVCHTPDLLARASTKLHWEGEQEARRNNRARALRLLQQAQVWNPYLSYDPKTRAEQFYLIGEGETFAQLGEVEEARAFMKRALELDSSLSIDLEARVNRLVTPALLEKADRAIFEEDIETAISAFEQAQALDPEQISDSRWAKLCQSGSLAGYASDVLWACDLAVEKDSFPGRLRSRRGVARALSNDIEGAIDNFEAYINWTYSEGALVFEKKCLEVDRLRRQRWTDALRSGQNPFTPEELEKLR